MKKQQAFTLIELMVTLAVLAIIATMAAPSFQQQLRQLQLKNDVQDVLNVAAETRSEAIFRRKSQTLVLDSNSGGGFKNWQPSKNTTWEKKEKPMVYNAFGYLKDEANCQVLKHVKDDSFKAVIYFNKNGSVIYDKTARSCPGKP